MNILKAEIHQLHNNPPSDLREETIMERSLKMQEKLTHLAEKRHRKTRIDINLKNKLESETISKYWTSINKEKKPRDMIYALRKSEDPNHNPNNTTKYEKNSQRMAEMARNYHENLQFLETEHKADQREQKIKDALTNIDTEPNNNQLTTLANDISEVEVIDALKLSKNGSAADLDGSIYEL